MADAKATFAIGLETEGLVRPGDEAADVLEKLKTKIQGDLKALSQLNAAMKNLKGGTSTNVAAFRELKEKIDRHRASLSSAQSDYVNLGGKLGDLAKKATAGKAGFRGMIDSLAGARGPLGSGASGVQRLIGGLTSARLVAIAAAAAFIAIGVAVTIATGKLISYGLAAANASRAERLHLEGLVSIRNMYGLAAGKASDLQAAIDDVSGSSALGRDKVAGYAEQLYKMGLRGENLADALEGTAIKASVQGEEMASMFMGMAAGANMAGGSVKRLADRVRGDIGGIAKAKALDLNIQIEKLHENFAQLFAGVNIERFLGALDMVTKLFSQSTVTGQVLKRLLAGIFDPVNAAAEFTAPLVKKFFQGMILAALDFEIAILRLRLWLRDTFGGATLSNAKLIETALFLGKIAAFTFLGVLVLVGAAFALLGLAVIGAAVIIEYTLKIIWAILVFIGTVIKGTGELLGGMVFLFVSGFKEIIAWVAKVGPAIIDGIMKWLENAPAVVGAKIGEIGGAIKKAFTSALGIGSPSKVFIGYGVDVTEGFAGGLEKGRPSVRQSLGEMVQAPGDAVGSRAAAAGAGAAGAAAGSSVTIHELHYHSSGRGQHAADAEDFKSQLERVLDGAQIQMGAT